jgi:hypothetical protein
MASADLLLHPVRLRIVQAFLGERALTTSQLADELADVPAGSLYRHVATLRGAVERTYMLRLHAAQIDPGQIAAMTPEQHSQAFMAFVAGLLADFERYLAARKPDPARDRAGYRMAALWLTDSEFDDFVRDLVAVIQPRLANPPTKRRQRRLIAGVTLPAPETQTRSKK